MPRGDRTGPEGVGAMTGRGAGFCAGYNNPGYMNPGFGRGRGLGRGRGMGRGFGRGFGRRAAYPYPAAYATAAREDELAALKGEADDLGRTLQDVERRIAELEKGD